MVNTRRNASIVVVLLCALVGGSVVTLLAAPAAMAAGVCPNEVFRVGPSAGLPDCRAYEMVSPPNKNGGQVTNGVNLPGFFLTPPQQAAADGEAVTYGSTTAFPEADAASATIVSQYLSQRTSSGWRTSEIIPTQEYPEGRFQPNNDAVEFDLYQGFNEELTDGFLLAWNPQPVPSAPAGYYNPYLFEAGSGRYQLLSGGVTPPSFSPGGHPSFSVENGFVSVYAGMSADGKHVIFEANDALTANAIPGNLNLYEWSVGRPLELINEVEGNAIDSEVGVPISIGGSSGSPMGFGTPQAGTKYPPNFGGVLSSNGMRAFWNGGTSTGDQLYMHELTGGGPRTVDVSASQRSGQPVGGGRYWTANSTGSLVYFTSPFQLTEDSTANGNVNDLYESGLGDIESMRTGSDLYSYDTETGDLSDLSVDPNAGETASVQGVLGSGESEGVSYVYFVAQGKLSSGATAGANNLYVSRGSGAPVFIATLGNYTGNIASNTLNGGEVGDFTANITERTSRVSPNGQYVAFQSVVPLTGYDNIPADGVSCPEREKTIAEEKQGGVFYETLYYDPPEGRCMEVFEYGVKSGLTCVSCEAGGVPPTANSLIPETSELSVNITGWQSPTVQQRYLLDDGRLYFESESPLLAQATNGKMNVYEYEPASVGECAAGGPGGCLYLISPGNGSGESYFADASASGRDVFILTGQQLVPQDGDEAVDMYDAREAGGFASGSPPPCSGEACRPPLQPAPAIYGPPASATFEGAGNPITAFPVKAKPKAKPAAGCKRGYVKKKNRCVKKAGANKARAKKSNRARAKKSSDPRGSE